MKKEIHKQINLWSKSPRGERTVSIKCIYRYIAVQVSFFFNFAAEN